MIQARDVEENLEVRRCEALINGKKYSMHEMLSTAMEDLMC